MPQINKASYETKSAVLFVVFNRPDTTSQVFEQIRIAKPRRLYLAADGPRKNFPDDTLSCIQTKEIVQNVDWECEVKTLFREENLGCKNGVSAAVTWFFDQEEEGIILEDDCLPANGFFKFCDTLLEKYRNDTRIRHITGCNLQQGKKWGDGSYYFSNRTHVWGWAGWRRAWKDYDKNLDKYDANEIRDKMQNIYPDPVVVDCWVNIFKELKEGKINSWAYQLDFINFFNNGLIIIPNENLISNIGFRANATNTFDVDSVFANVPLSDIEDILDPLFIVPEKQADLFIINNHFNIEEKRRKQNLLRKKVRRWFKSTLQKAASIMFLS
jgi:hypothetical protein